MQGPGVQACAKHYIGNEQEKSRNTMSANIDDRTMHELYLWPFADAVQANVAPVMCSYNKANSTYACENDKLMSGLSKNELDFQGYVMSDWNAQHTISGSANGGLDMTMPGSHFNKGTILWGPQLTSAISSGAVAQSRVDDMVGRILAAWTLSAKIVVTPQYHSIRGRLGLMTFKGHTKLLLGLLLVMVLSCLRTRTTPCH